jgi:ribosomal protein L37AE/L43A
MKCPKCGSEMIERDMMPDHWICPICHPLGTLTIGEILEDGPL